MTYPSNDRVSSDLEELLSEKFEEALKNSRFKGKNRHLQKMVQSYSPIDLAYAAYYLPSQAKYLLYNFLPNHQAKIDFMINTDNDTRVVLFRQMKEKDLKILFEKMPLDEVVWVCQDMSERRLHKVLDLLDYSRAVQILDLKKQNPRCAARMMTSEFFSFPWNISLKDVIAEVEKTPRVDVNRGIFVVNEGKELEGYLPFRSLLVQASHLPLRQIMKPIFHKVHLDTSREEVIDLVEKYKISSLPVVDEKNHLLGVVCYQDVVEAMEDLTDETLAKMIGTKEKMDFQDRIYKRFLARAPWLIVTLIAGLLNVEVMSFFRTLQGKVLTFTFFFVPLITGMSGNIGIQCSTVLVRGMAIGHLSESRKREAVIKELKSGLLIGLVFGFLCGFLVYFLDAIGGNLEAGPLAVATIVATGLIGACFTGSFLGVFSPLVFSKLGVDPAISSGPIVTALNDVLSMTIYFLIAWGLGSLFF